MSLYGSERIISAKGTGGRDSKEDRQRRERSMAKWETRVQARTSPGRPMYRVNHVSDVYLSSMRNHDGGELSGS